MAPHNLKTTAMTDSTTQLLMAEDEPTQTEAKYPSSDEDTKSEYPMSDQELTGDVADQGLNQLVIQSNDPANVAQTKNRTFDVNMPPLSPSATTESQLSKQTRISQHWITTSHYGSQPFELRQSLPTKNSTESPTPSNQGPTNLFKSCDLPDTPHAQQSWTTPYQISCAGTPRTGTKCTFRSVHANLRMHWPWRVLQTSPWVNGRWLHTTHNWAAETFRDRRIRRQDFLACRQSGVVTFVPADVSQAATCDGVKNHFNNGHSV